MTSPPEAGDLLVEKETHQKPETPEDRPFPAYCKLILPSLAACPAKAHWGQQKNHSFMSSLLDFMVNSVNLFL